MYGCYLTSDDEFSGRVGFQFELVSWKFSAKRKQNPLNEPELIIASDEHADIVVWSSVNTRKSLLSSTVVDFCCAFDDLDDKVVFSIDDDGDNLIGWSICWSGIAMPKSIICKWNIKLSSDLLLIDDWTLTKERIGIESLFKVANSPCCSFQ